MEINLGIKRAPTKGRDSTKKSTYNEKHTKLIKRTVDTGLTGSNEELLYYVQQRKRRRLPIEEARKHTVR
jgi:hypothetical protein